MALETAKVAVPPFWLANLNSVNDYLDHQISRGVNHRIGHSSLGHPLSVIEYPNPKAAYCLLVIGGTHGHEPGTVAAAMNLIHIMETGSGLDGKLNSKLTELAEQVHLYIMPVLNPDGRTVCLDSFVGLTVDACTAYASGLQKDGSVIPYDAGSDEPLYYFNPEEAIFVGGQFNGAGIAINRRKTIDPVDAVEAEALLEFVRGRSIEAVLDLHACGYNFAFQVRSHPAPYWPVMREWQRRAEQLFAERGSPLNPLYGDGDPPTPPAFHFNSSVFHQRAHLMWIAFEGRQGYLGSPSFMPQPDHATIVQDYLSAIQVFIELGNEGWYARANQETFGAASIASAIAPRTPAS